MDHSSPDHRALSGPIGMALITLLACQSALADDALLTNVRIFDGVRDGLSEVGHVLIEGNRIARISASPIEVPIETLIIDGGGRTLMPGLIDCQAHLIVNVGSDQINDALDEADLHIRSTAAARLALRDGYTSCRTVSGGTLSLKGQIDRGIVAGPRIFPTGACLTTATQTLTPHRLSEPEAGLLGRLGLAKDTAFSTAGPQARANLMQAASHITLIDSSTQPWTDTHLEEVVTAAADWGTYVSFHFNDVLSSLDTTAAPIDPPLRAGVRTLEGVAILPEASVTRAVTQGVFFLPSAWKSADQARMDESMSIIQPAKQAMLQQLVTQQARVAFGSNAMGELNDVVHWRRYELFWRAEVCGSPFAVLKQATSVAGQLLAQSGQRHPYPGELGIIKANALADLLIVDGNPLEDITLLGAQESVYDQPPPRAIPTIRFIMKDGVIYKNTIDGQLSSTHRTSVSRPQVTARRGVHRFFGPNQCWCHPLGPLGPD